MAKGRARKTRRNNASQTVTSGQQELTQITLGTPSGTFVGGQFPLIPTFEPSSRLGVLALQYSQYSIEVSRVSFITQTTVNTSGRLAMAWTFDAEDANPVNIHQILQISRARMTVVWKNTSTAMPRNSPEKRRFPVIDAPTFAGLSGQDKQIYTPATIIFGSDGSAQSGLTVGSLIWHYRIRFFNPNVQTGVPTFLTLGNAATSSAGTLTHRFIEVGEEEEEDVVQEVFGPASSIAPTTARSTPAPPMQTPFSAERHIRAQRKGTDTNV